MDYDIYKFNYNNETFYYIESIEPEEVIIEKDDLKNQIKYYGKYTCGRCHGKGNGWWPRDNGICYLCHGYGYTVKTLKVTKNYNTIIRRLNSIKKKDIEDKQQFLNNNLNRMLKMYGDKFYLILDTKDKKTYDNREYLKSKGARWKPEFRCWWSKNKDIKDFDLIEVITQDHLNEFNIIITDQIQEIISNNRGN